MDASQAAFMHIVTVGSLMAFKLTVLLVGYLIAKLGHDLLIKGVTGEFKFKAEIKGTKADLMSASPGIFFIFLAVVLMAIGVIKDKPFGTKVTETSLESAAEQHREEVLKQEKPEFPDIKMKKENE